MKKRFIGSKEFVIATVLSVIILLLTSGLFVAAYVGSTFIGSFVDDACSPAAAYDVDLDMTVEDTGVIQLGHSERQTITHHLPVGNATLGFVAACVGVGDIRIQNGTSDEVMIRIAMHTHGDAWGSVRDITFQTMGRAAGDRIDVSVRQLSGGSSALPFWGNDIHVTLDIFLPETMTWSLDVEAAVGNIDLERVTTNRVDARTDVGDIESTGFDANGEIRAHTDVGDIHLVFADRGVTRITTGTDVGDQELHVIQENATAWAIDMRADVGSAGVIGRSMTTTRHHEEGPSETLVVTTEGNPGPGGAPVPVRMSSDVGDIRIRFE